ncbi:hypothetical protein B0H19DRAFT_1273236 [Mycena capillaripes]|nr:hypothetical protein B0H19DRAFT_1273236 [Mycena capillaripes]
MVSWSAGKKANKMHGLATFEEISCVRVANPAEITGLAFDAPSNCLAVCHQGGIVQVYALASTMALQEIFALELKNVAPRAIAFGQMFGNERDVMVFGLYGGDIYTLRGGNGQTTGETWNVGAFIGNVAIDTRKGVLCMDEPSSGANLYRLEDRAHVKTFPIKVKKNNDHSIVYVFDRRSGDIVDELRVDPHEWVQTVAAAECAGVSSIFAAKSRDLVGANEIFIWHKKSKKWAAALSGGSRGLRVPEFNYHPDVKHVWFEQLHLNYERPSRGVAAVNGAADVQHQQSTSMSKRPDLRAYNAPQHSERATPTHPADVQHMTHRHLIVTVTISSQSCPPILLDVTSSLSPPGPLAELRPAELRPAELRPAFSHSAHAQMSSHSYHTASRGSRPSMASQPTSHHFCRRCDICPTCGSLPPTERTTISVPAPPAPAPNVPIQLLFTLFLIEAQLTGDWCHLLIPYAAALLIFFLSLLVFFL